MDEQRTTEQELSVEEMLAWGEFCAWSALVMTPIIWWLQGPSVSTDQFVVRMSLVVISALAGVGLRLRTVTVRRKAKAGGRVAQETAGGPTAGDSNP